MLLVLGISSVGVLLSVLQISVPQLQPNPYPLSLTEDSQDKRRNVSQVVCDIITLLRVNSQGIRNVSQLIMFVY